MVIRPAAVMIDNREWRSPCEVRPLPSMPARLRAGTETWRSQAAVDGHSGKGYFPLRVTSSDLPEAVALLIAAQTHYAAVQADADRLLLQAQEERETAMRRVAGLGLSHRRIAELTGLSHTRINQILGTGRKRPPEDIHFPPGFLPPPASTALAALRVIGEEGPRAWRLDEIAQAIENRGWPVDRLHETLVELVTEGTLLPVDGGHFTLHGYGQHGQAAPNPFDDHDRS
jgi:hypothetical protein